MSIIFKKIKLRDKMFASVEYDEVHTGDSVRDSCTKECNHPVHDDFKNHMQALAAHCVLITELVDVTKVKGDLENYHPALLDHITVKSISLGSTEGEGVTISFERKLSNGKVVNMNTPYTKYYDEATPYKFNTDLELAVNDLLKEAEEYLAGNKYGVKQATMDFDKGEGSPDETNPL